MKLAVRILAPVLVVVAAVAAWWFASASSTSLFFPPLKDIVSAFRANWLSSAVFDQALPSLARLGIGMLIAVVGGVAIGALLGVFPKVELFARPELDFMRALPPILIFPPLLLVLGTGNTMKITVIAASSVWPILLATTDGVRGVEPVREDMSRAFGLPWRARMRWVVLPTAVPHVWSGVRAAAPIGIVVMVASEYYASTNGLGNFISQTSTTFRLADMWSAVLLLGFLGIVINAIVTVIGRRLDRRYGEFGGSTESE